VISKSADRVIRNSSHDLNRAIRDRTKRSIVYFRQHPEEISHRLDELDTEWDIERALEAGSSTLSLLGLALGFSRGRRWFLLPLAVQGFFLQHAVQGWCPPVPILRRLGFRTPGEIERERYALKALRGDVIDTVLEGRVPPETAEPLVH